MRPTKLDGFNPKTYEKFLEKYSEMISNYSTHIVCMSSLLCAMLHDSKQFNEIFVTNDNLVLNESMDSLWGNLSQLSVVNDPKTPAKTTSTRTNNPFDINSSNSDDNDYPYSYSDPISNSAKSLRPDLIASELQNYTITTEMITSFFNSVSSDVEIASENLNNHIREKLNSLSCYCNIDTYNESLIKKAYKDVVCGILEFVREKYLYFQNIADAYRPLSMYSDVGCLLKDNCKLSNYLKDASLRWITLSQLTCELRPPHITLNPTHLKYMSMKSPYDLLLNKNVKNDMLNSYEQLIKLYCDKLSALSISNVDIPCCYHVFPSIIENLLKNCCDNDTLTIALSSFDMENHQYLNSVIYSEGAFHPWNINGHQLPNETNPTKTTKNIIQKLDSIYNMIASETNLTDNNIFLDEQNIVVKQLAALLCPSIAYFASKVALLLLFGNNHIVECKKICNYNTECSVINFFPDGTNMKSYQGEFDNHIPTISTVLNSIDLQVPIVWNVYPKESILEHFVTTQNHRILPLATIKTVFKLTIDVNELFTSSFFLLSKVNVKVMNIRKDNVLLFSGLKSIINKLFTT